MTTLAQPWLHNSTPQHAVHTARWLPKPDMLGGCKKRACSAAAMRPLRQQVSSRDCHMWRSLSVSRAAPTGSRSTWPDRFKGCILGWLCRMVQKDGLQQHQQITMQIHTGSAGARSAIFNMEGCFIMHTKPEGLLKEVWMREEKQCAGLDKGLACAYSCSAASTLFARASAPTRAPSAAMCGITAGFSLACLGCLDRCPSPLLPRLAVSLYCCCMRALLPRPASAAVPIASASVSSVDGLCGRCLSCGACSGPAVHSTLSVVLSGSLLLGKSLSLPCSNAVLSCAAGLASAADPACSDGSAVCCADCRLG